MELVILRPGIRVKMSYPNAADSIELILGDDVTEIALAAIAQHLEYADPKVSRDLWWLLQRYKK